MEAKPTMRNLKELKLFDSCITLGRFSGECVSTADELLDLMDRYCIEEALVHDYHARFVYPLQNGNQRLLNMIREKKRLHPVWIMEPPDEPGKEAAEKVVSSMLEAGVRVARLRIRSKGVLPWLWENLLAALETHRIPTFFDFGSTETTIGELSDTDVDALYVMVQKHPHLPVVISRIMGGLGVHPAIIPLISRLPNLYIDITGILEYWRTVAYKAGPDRVLFATGIPFTDPGILVSNVQYALDLDDTAKRMICGDNLRKLIGGVV